MTTTYARRTPTVRQQNAWLAVADGIEVAIEDGQQIPCINFPGLYTTVERAPRRRGRPRREPTEESDSALRRRLCRSCPVYGLCVNYAGTNPDVSGYLPSPGSIGSLEGGVA